MTSVGLQSIREYKSVGLPPRSVSALLQEGGAWRTIWVDNIIGANETKSPPFTTMSFLGKHFQGSGGLRSASLQNRWFCSLWTSLYSGCLGKVICLGIGGLFAILHPRIEWFSSRSQTGPNEVFLFWWRTLHLTTRIWPTCKPELVDCQTKDTKPKATLLFRFGQLLFGLCGQKGKRVLLMDAVTCRQGVSPS